MARPNFVEMIKKAEFFHLIKIAFHQGWKWRWMFFGKFYIWCRLWNTSILYRSGQESRHSMVVLMRTYIVWGSSTVWKSTILPTDPNQAPGGVFRKRFFLAAVNDHEVSVTSWHAVVRFRSRMWRASWKFAGKSDTRSCESDACSELSWCRNELYIQLL